MFFPAPALRSVVIVLTMLLAQQGFAATPASVQERAAAHLTFQRQIRDTLGQPQWLRSGAQFVYWSATGPQRGTWLQVDAASGAARALIAPQALTAQLQQLGGAAAQPLYNPPFTLAPDERSLLFQAGPRSFALELASGKLSLLAAADIRALRLSPDHLFAPDGRAVAAGTAGGWTLDDGGQRRTARSAGTERYWELPQNAWSPDSAYLLAWQTDQRAVHKLPVTDYAGVLEKTEQVPYARVGTPLAKQALFAVERRSGRVRPLPLPQDEGYLWLAGWRSAGHALVLHLSRDGKRLRLFDVDPAGAPARLVLTEERAESFVGDLNFITENWQHQVTPLPDQRRFLWMSERDGYRHAYLYGYDGKLERQVTRGEFPVQRVAAVTPDMVTLYAVGAAADAPYDQLLYAAPLAGGAMTRMSAQPGSHKVHFAPGLRYFTDGYSDLTHPRQWAVRQVDGGPGVVYASADASALTALGYTPPEAFQVSAADGSTQLHGRLYKPHDFDPNKRYAIIEVIYGAPFTSLVPNSFTGTSAGNLASALAQLGFVTVLMDARGAPGRSKAFHDAHYGRIGQQEIAEHVGALRQLAASRPYIDLARAGLHGHSWGGYFTLRGMLTAPDFFKAGYAGAPGGLDQDAAVNEPNLGLRSANPDAYRLGANEPLAGQLRGALKIMHGTADVNAPLSSTMRMADALIKAGKHVELLIMPGEGHTPEGEAGRYYFEDVGLFFQRTLGPPVSTPKGAASER